MVPVYSFIVPIYNEEDNLLELYRRLLGVIGQLNQSAEIILVNDGSRDRSLKMMRELHAQDSRVCYVNFARNFGHQTAVTAGLNFARGQAIITMDADLQDPPELALDMVQRWQDGYQVVYAQRQRRLQESYTKRWTAYLFYRILRRLADVDIPADTGDFCLMDRKVVAALNAMPEHNRYLRGLRAWSGFRQTSVKFTRSPRHAGSVKYTFRKSLSLAADGIISFSKVPLRMATYIGLLSALLAVLMMVLVVYWRIAFPESSLTGFAIIATAIFFLGAVQLFCIGILGEYIGRIHEEVKGRPLYTLDEVVGFEDA